MYLLQMCVSLLVTSTQALPMSESFHGIKNATNMIYAKIKSLEKWPYLTACLTECTSNNYAAMKPSTIEFAWTT